ncbi:MAG: winged helix-turn-helix transcriptional regulator [Candidatus Bathyarchaeota archaeon]|nr:MAG: winged helix-turn-helix transcriptional regulator [Candidatus Bathyarchaeota archaeon]
MKLKLQLVRNGEIFFEIPLSMTDWSREQLEDEMEAFDADCQRLSKVFDALAHETRLRMMKRLMQEEDRTMKFVDFMKDLDLNPKIVWENARKLRDGGFLEKVERGRYRCSNVGHSGFILMSLVLRHLVEALEETDEFWRGER